MKKILLCFCCLLLLAQAARADGDDGGRAAYGMDEVVITATKTPHLLKDVPVETVVITREDIQRSNAQNIVDILKEVPGINTSMHDDVFGTYTWRASMQGLSFNDGYALILVDGHRMMGCGQSGGMGEYGIGLNQIPLEMIERIEVVKGPSSALYGSDAVSGVVNIITRKVPSKATGRAGVAYGWYDIKNRVRNGVVTRPSDEGRSRNLSQAYVSFGDRVREDAGYLISYAYESAEDIGQDPVKSDRHSLLGKWYNRFSDGVELYLDTGLSTYEKADYRDEDSYQVSARLEFNPAKGHFFTLRGYLYDWDFNHGYPGYAYGYKYGDVGYKQGEARYSWYLGDWNVLTLGGELQRQAIDYDIENPDGSLIGVRKDVDTSSLYAQDELTLFDSLTLVGGMRYDDHSTFGSELNPKFSMMYRPSPDTVFRASVGKAFKSPTIRELYYSAPYRHGSYYCRSNPDLKPEKAVGYSASVEQWLLGHKIMFNIGYFRNDVDDMVIREDTGSLYNGLPLKEYRNVEKAWTQGVECLGRLYLSQDLSATLSYTYTDSENKETGRELTYVPNHVLSLSPAYELRDLGFGASATISYVSRQYTNSDNTAQIDGYSVVDGKIFKLLSNKAKLTLEVDNIFDSDKGDQGNFRTGRTYTVKLDLFM